jgi:predicted ATP-grasp superfamily ATP-dependent carboligase
MCPADVCMTDKPTVAITAYEPPLEIIEAVQAVAEASHLDVGGIEYMIDDRDGAARFFDINALSNFVADPVTVLGYDPHDKLVDFLIDEIANSKRDPQ